ncbi:MAG: hypothetical protein HOI95_12690 [Chromatiales bacterium]|nr:hypothetical protein [Chromatiales bacterium]
MLALFLEAAGLPTTIVSLIRLHSEKVSPPRSLWVPFELGRPLGDPGDEATQLDVVTRALSLLTTAEAPGVIEDYVPSQSSAANHSWTGPALRAESLDDEVTELMPRYEAAQAAVGKTTVGVSKLSVTEIAGLVHRATQGDYDFPDEADGLPYTLRLRYALDDLKSFYTEAGAAGDNQPSSDELGDWFWRETTGGRTLIGLRERLMATDRKGLQTLGANLTVPRYWLHRLGL